MFYDIKFYMLYNLNDSFFLLCLLTLVCRGRVIVVFCLCVCVSVWVCVVFNKRKEIAFCVIACVKKKEYRIVYIVIIVVCLMVSSDFLISPTGTEPSLFTSSHSATVTAGRLYSVCSSSIIIV